MKILALAFILLSAVSPAPSYALIGDSGALLRNAGGEIITSLPATYFVTVMDEDELKYRVSYLDIDGYILKNESSVTVADYEPVTKYAQPAFTADNDTHPVNLRAAPASDSAIICAVPDGGRGVYYGKRTGDAIVEGIADWYYARYYDGEYRYGYVYAPQIKADSIAENIIEKVSKPHESDDGDKPSVLSGAAEGIFIAALCIPAVIVMFVIFRSGSRRDPRHLE